MDERVPFWFRAPNFVPKIPRATPVLGLKPSGGDGGFYSGDRKRHEVAFKKV